MIDTILLIVAGVLASGFALLLISRLSFLQGITFFRKINTFQQDQQKCSVMDVHIDWSKGTIECHDWISQRISPFCGKFTWELWDEILPYIRTSENSHGRRETHIFIIKDWSEAVNGRGEKFQKVNWLASCEPISEYIKNKELLKTGNGYKNYYIEKNKEAKPREIAIPVSASKVEVKVEGGKMVSVMVEVGDEKRMCLPFTGAKSVIIKFKE